MKTKFICPVCGYPNLEEAPLNFIEEGIKYFSYSKGAPTYCICPCCGTEFGYDDYETSWENLRDKWIKNGANWFSKSKTKPKNWVLKNQLLNLEKISELPYRLEKIKNKK